MRWLARFLAWATALAVPSWLIGDAYHHALARASLWVLRLPSQGMEFQPPDVPASHVLGIYAALCLASARSPLPKRMVALAIGLVGMVAIELLTGVVAIRWSLEAAAGGAALPSALRFRSYLTSLPAWIGAPILWLLLLGGRELPAAPRPHPVRADPPGGA